MKSKLTRELPETAPVVTNDPTRVLVQEVPAPGEAPALVDTSFNDLRSIAAARRSRPGGYLRLPIQAVKALGKQVVLLSKAMNGTDLVLRVRLFALPATARSR